MTSFQKLNEKNSLENQELEINLNMGFSENYSHINKGSYHEFNYRDLLFCESREQVLNNYSGFSPNMFSKSIAKFNQRVQAL